MGRTTNNMERAEMSDSYAFVKTHFERVAGVTVNDGRGAQGLKVGGKMFAMFFKGRLLLARERNGPKTWIST